MLKKLLLTGVFLGVLAAFVATPPSVCIGDILVLRRIFNIEEGKCSYYISISGLECRC